MQSLWMLAAGLAFSLMGAFVKLGAEHFSAAELVFYRSLVQMAGAYAVLVHAGLPVKTKRFGMHVHRGVSGFVSLFMFFYALTTLPVATAMTLNYSSPLFLALLLTFLARERPGAHAHRHGAARASPACCCCCGRRSTPTSCGRSSSGWPRVRSRRSRTGTSASSSARRSRRRASCSTSRCSPASARWCGWRRRRGIR